MTGVTPARAAVAGGTDVRFSIISAARDVARYLPEFIDSIERQRFPLSRVEVIAVDDGSTDDTLALLQAWQQRRPELVTVLSQSNQGAPAARNAGLDRARGEWVTFTDPDDMLDPDCLANVDEFLTENPQVSMAACNRKTWDEYTQRIVRYPMARAVPASDRVVNLRTAPESFYDSASAAFFDREVLERIGLRFDPRVRPTFDGGLFCARFLLAQEEPEFGYLTSAVYLHRRRADNMESLNVALRDPDRFRVVPRAGILALLRESADDESAPEWVQNLVIYELGRYFRPEQVSAGAATAVRGELADTFVQTLTEIVQNMDSWQISSYQAARFDGPWREILLHGLSGRPWVSPHIVAIKHDPIRKQVQVSYTFVGPAPEEEVLVGGRPIEVTEGKIRVHEYFDRPMLYERLAWLPAHRALRVLLDGRPHPILSERPETPRTLVRPSRLREWAADPEDDADSGPVLTAAERTTVMLARSSVVRRRYAGAWVLMDKTHEANDNAERLFAYLRAERPDVNAWFVLDHDSPDWQRLSEVDRGRVVRYGSRQWKLLMLNCAHVVSSQADRAVLWPAAVARLGERRWKFSFIQHGVIKSDLSRWLNNQVLDLMVTSTPMEWESIAGDYTPYRLTPKEVKLTGLPRFDRLRELGDRVEPADRDVIIICPTWRYWLTLPKQRGSHRRSLIENFLHSEYAQMWLGLLGSETLRKLADTHGQRVVFLPHPNVQAALSSLPVPPHVQAVSYAGNDIQQLLARSSLMITDYSSVSFDAAYLDRPVVYFQFDAERVLEGGHNGRPGYYDHVEHGFGPITQSVDETVAAVETILTVEGRVPAPIFQARIDAAFPERDGRCCERTAEAISKLTKPVNRPAVRYLS